MILKQSGILVSFLYFFISTSCYSQDRTGEVLSGLRARAAAPWSLLRIVIPPYAEATSEEKNKLTPSPALKRANTSKQELVGWLQAHQKAHESS